MYNQFSQSMCVLFYIRADKIKKAMRKSVAGQSETGSEHSAIGNDRGSREINIAENFPNLPSPPEKGIYLKKKKIKNDL